jgi:hypothetical protein
VPIVASHRAAIFVADNGTGWRGAGAASGPLIREQEAAGRGRDSCPILAPPTGRLYGPPCAFLVPKFPLLPRVSRHPPRRPPVAWYGSMRSSTTAIGSLPGRDGNRVRLYTRLVTTGPASIRGKLHRFRRSKGRVRFVSLRAGEGRGCQGLPDRPVALGRVGRRYSRKG